MRNYLARWMTIRQFTRFLLCSAMEQRPSSKGFLIGRQFDMSRETQAEFDRVLRYGDDHNRRRTTGAAKRIADIQNLWAKTKDIEGFGFEDRAVLEQFVLKCCADSFDPPELSAQEKLYAHNLCYGIETKIIYEKPAVDPKDWRS